MANPDILKAGQEEIDLRTLTHSPISDLVALRAMAQLAVQVEFTTIPAYLSALYSITDTGSDAYQALRSVVMEEMYHLNQAANILVGIGGKPVLTGEAVPHYPAYLPSASTSDTPYVGLFRASRAVFRDVFMAVETPAPWNAPAEGENYKTIGQLYKALWDGICACVERYGEAAVFKQADDAEQRTDIYLGKFGGTPVEVKDKASAERAINQIVEQGEGAVDPTHPLVPYQPFGSYQHYGTRTDGTYGPILGTPFELSHFYKFMNVANAEIFPETRPTVSNPRISSFANQRAVDLAHAFNNCYSVVLRSLEMAFTKTGGAAGVYFKITLPMMHHQLPALALMLMQTPTFPDGDSGVGPNAAPTFEYVDGASFASLLGSLKPLDSREKEPSAMLFAAGTGLTGPTPASASGHGALSQTIAGVADLKNLSDEAGLGL